ncbi:MAG: cyclase family protein [Gemmatimonadota bacterium]
MASRGASAAQGGGWIDISRPVSDGIPVWPGDPPWRYRLAAAIERGDPANVGEVAGTTHAGTHADAPLHVDPAGAGIDALPLEAFAGPATVVDVSEREGLIVPEEIEAALEVVGVDSAGEDFPERLLLRTGCDWSAGFPTRCRGLSPRAATWCGERGLKLVGTDAPSVDPLDSDTLDAHRAIMAAGMVIVESLALAGIEPGRYELVAFPLRWIGADASPVRAALRRIVSYVTSAAQH